MVPHSQDEGYSLTKGTPTGDCLRSHPFTVGGLRWFIRYYPNGDISEAAAYVSLYLVLDESVAKEVKAQFQIRVAEQVAKKPLTSEEVTSFSAHGSWGYRKFIRREELERSEHLKDDSFTIRCDLVVVNEFRAEEEKLEVAFVSVPPSDLHQHLGDLLLTEKGADVVFDVGSQTFAAHRCVLAARSPVFSAALFGRMKEGDTAGVVHIDDMDAQVFKALLHFVYTDSLPKTKKEKEQEETEEEEEEDVIAQHLLVAADRYNMERLKLICEEKLCRFIEVGTVATILTLAEQHHCQGLKKACFGFLSCSANLRAVMTTDGYDHLSKSCPSIMKELVAMLAT
ncbi:hypothetical protein ACP70R_019295 [Stipagrostis hirtigluma subsp. patula]